MTIRGYGFGHQYKVTESSVFGTKVNSTKITIEAYMNKMIIIILMILIVIIYINTVIHIIY